MQALITIQEHADGLWSVGFVGSSEVFKSEPAARRHAMKLQAASKGSPMIKVIRRRTERADVRLNSYQWS